MGDTNHYDVTHFHSFVAQLRKSLAWASALSRDPSWGLFLYTSIALANPDAVTTLMEIVQYLPKSDYACTCEL